MAPSRRQFLEALGLATTANLTSANSAEAAAPPGPADAPRDLRPTGANLGSLFGEIDKLAAANRYAYSFLGDRFATLADFKSTARAKVFELLLYRPDKVAPRPEVVERIDRGDHVREKVLFSTSPHFRVPAYVLLPKKARKPAPAIVDLHSHGGMFLFGKEKVIDLVKNHPAMTAYHARNYDGRPTATALVKRGYVVITIDALLFGERRPLLDADLKYGWDRGRYDLKDVAHLNQQARAKEQTLVKALTFAGLTWPGIVFWDDIRTVDYLVTRPEVDPKRIGCLGISMGGYRSLFLAGLDERIACRLRRGLPVERSADDQGPRRYAFVGTLRPAPAPLSGPARRRLVGGAPALLVQQCSRDALFPPAGMKEGVRNIAAVYKKGGAAEKFSGRFYDVPHQFTRAMQEDAFAWLDHHLKG